MERPGRVGRGGRLPRDARTNDGGRHSVERASETLRGRRVLNDPTPSAFASGFGESWVVLSVLLWVGDPNYRAVWKMRGSFHRRVAERFAESDITLNPPTGRTVTPRTDDTSVFADTLGGERAP